MSAALLTIFREVRDPRRDNARHDLADMLFVALAAVLCGAKTCVDMADFAESRLDMVRDIVDLAHGAPSHDTFSRVFRLLDPDELQSAFSRGMAAIRQELGVASPSGVVAIDGKSLRRGYDKGRAFMPPLMVNVFDSQTRLAISNCVRRAARRCRAAEPAQGPGPEGLHRDGGCLALPCRYGPGDPRRQGPLCAGPERQSAAAAGRRRSRLCPGAGWAGGARHE